MKDMVGGCCVCSDDRGWPENPLVYCDGQSCTVAVHQACYGIVTVPTGPWYCRKCESQERSVKVKCELCPSKYGALKRTDNSGWAHVVCALYIPEVRFGNVTTMEPIQLQLIPQERFNKVCYICEENGKPANASVGACMQCNKSGCKQQFHVTCAQSLGLLCEEAGNYLDNVKYCGYCQHHYSKLKKGGNVKTIPPYKPVSVENQQSDSSSEKDPTSAAAVAADKSGGGSSSSSLGKRKSSGASKSVTKVANVKSAPSYQKQVSGGGKVADKGGKTSAKSAKSTDDSGVSGADSAEKTEKKEADVEKEVSGKDNGGKGKKRKANSRTPTPNIVSEGSNQGGAVESAPPPPVAPLNPKKESPVRTESTEKPKKAKTESPQQASPPTVTAPQTTAANTAVSVPTASPTTATTAETVQITAAVAATTTATTSAPPVALSPQVNSVVVSVPLHNTSLSPHAVIPANNPIAVVLPPPPQAQAQVPEERKQTVATPTLPSPVAEEESMITSEMSGGGLKITYEKQPQQVVPMEIEEMVPAPVVEIPSKRASRSQSTDKNEKSTRSRKKNSNGLMNSLANVVTTSKRSSRSQHNTPPPQPSSFVGLTQSGAIKDSPPSSPSSESLSAPPTMGRKKGRKSAPASVSGSSTSNREKDSKENIKLFQNGVNAPHMLGNQLNLNSNMAQKMSDHLNSELEAHSIFNSGESSSNLMGPQLHHRVIASARSSSAGGSSTASGGSGLSSMLGGGGGAIPQTLDQLLERQWEQGSQFLMEQAQHFDIASLLSCLHQLRAENLRLEEHVSSLLQRRDHLLAVNARLAIPLTGTPASSQSAHTHTVNNIHPSVGVAHADTSRSRHGGSYSQHVQPVSQHQQSVAIENGISPTEQPYSHPPHRSPATNPPQPSPNIRQSSGGYSGSGLMRGNTESSSGRSAPRPPSYSMYQGPPNVQQQVVIRRDTEQQHTNPPKPS